MSSSATTDSMHLAAPVRGLHALTKACVRACEVLSIGLVAGIAIVVSAHVFFRYVLNSPLGWSDELSRYLMVWLAFFASPVVLDARGFTAVEEAQQLLGRSARTVVRMAIWVFVAAVLICLVWQGTWLAWNARTQVASSMPLSIGLVYAAVPIGSAAMLVVALDLLAREWQDEERTHGKPMEQAGTP